MKTKLPFCGILCYYFLKAKEAYSKDEKRFSWNNACMVKNDRILLIQSTIYGLESERNSMRPFFFYDRNSSFLSKQLKYSIFLYDWSRRIYIFPKDNKTHLRANIDKVQKRKSYFWTSLRFLTLEFCQFASVINYILYKKQGCQALYTALMTRQFYLQSSYFTCKKQCACNFYKEIDHWYQKLFH